MGTKGLRTFAILCSIGGPLAASAAGSTEPPSTWSACNEFVLTLTRAGSGHETTFRGAIQAKDGRLESIDSSSGRRIEGSALIVDGEVIAFRGFDGESLFAMIAFSKATDWLSVLEAALDAAAPGGPAGVTAERAVEHEDRSTLLRLATGDSLGEHWILRGAVRPGAAGAVDVDVVLIVPGDASAQTHTVEIPFKATLSASGAKAILRDDQSLRGWRVEWLPSKRAAEHSDRHRLDRAGLTVGDLRHL